MFMFTILIKDIAFNLHQLAVISSLKGLISFIDCHGNLLAVIELEDDVKIAHSYIHRTFPVCDLP